MSRGKKWIVAALVLLVLGVLICAASYRAFGFDLGKLSTVKLVTKTYDVSEEFRSIRIDGDTEKISFVLSRDGSCSVVCLEEEDDPHQVSVQGDTLRIERNVRQKAHINFGIMTERPAITVYLPETAYEALTVDADTGDVEVPAELCFVSISVTLDTGSVRCQASAEGDISIRTDTGRITVSDLTADGMKLASDTGWIEAANVDVRGDLEITEDTGRVTMDHVTCRNFTSRGDTGDLVMTKVLASGEFNLERSTGDIEFKDCDADTIVVITDTGDVFGTLLSDKVFLTRSDTGRIQVPETITGGTCKITTDTGDIRIEIR